MGTFRLVCAALFALLASAPGHAAGTVKIGAIYPLTGNAASAGASAKDAVELGLDIVDRLGVMAMDVDADLVERRGDEAVDVGRTHADRIDI